uniref:ADP ribosylation factor like GTPase 14 effector protein n=1 Tax=Aotus nancymaae TaxID=37293 RepID=A0A2K5EEK0_AOTNA
MMDPCSVGVQLRTTNECHKTYYTRHTGFKTLQELSSNDMIYRSHVVTHLTYTKNYAKFGRQLVPGWKLCPKCTQIINGSVDVDTETARERKPESDGRTAKALRSLQFTNPGRQTEFAPETGKREKRRLTKNATAGSDRQVIPAKSKVYDSQGLLIFSGMDLCDCLDEDCLGCFYACPACGSTKCGAECRCDRKWLYEQIEIEGGEIIHNKHAG